MKKNKKLQSINIEKELKKSYLDYAMSVIIGRALPDIRDGLKPVHRRILYSMYILKNNFNKPYKKSARIVGDVIGKYHPHGDNAVYDSIVRMAQNFSLRYPLIDGQGNFGSIDGDSPAAMRYTEIRMSKITKEFLKDIKKNTINFVSNYDDTEKIPEILPTKIPNILINGSTGIAVGMATNIPPHNIKEVMNTFIAFIDNKKISTKSLMKYIKGPDFPTGGIIENNKEIYKAYKTGKGTIKIKAKIKIENNLKNKKKYIIIHELPYQINKTKLIEKIIDLIKNKKIDGINKIIDESNKDGMRILIEVKKNTKRKILINKLFYLTNLETSYGINIVALYKNQPKILNLKKIIKIFIKHRKNIIKKKTLFKINKIKKKIHILEGLLITSKHIKKIINIIINSKNIKNVKKILIKKEWKTKKIYKIKNIKYKLSIKQIKSLLNLSLNKLTKIEKNKIKKEYFNLKKKKKKLTNILINKNILKKIIKKEFIKIKKKFSDNRNTKINIKQKILKIKDLIKKEKIIIILTKTGYINYQKISKYDTQHRGGKGKTINKIKKNDYIINTLITDTHKKIFLFSNLGKCFEKNIYEFPQKKNIYISKPINNFIKIKKKEYINFLLEKKNKKLFNNLIITTHKGLIKKIKINKLNIKKKIGLNIINLKKKDKIISTNFTNGKKEIMLFTKLGKSIRFHEKNIRITNRKSSGIKGIKLLNKDKIITSLVIDENNNKKEILIVTEKGYGKRTLIKEFNKKSRATKGIKSIKINKKNGNVVGVIQTSKKNQIVIITNKGNIVRIKIKEIQILKRNTQGVILIRLNNKEKVINIQKI